MTIIPYSARLGEVWDTFVRQSRNGTFLLERRFMDYHADRFADSSLMVYDGIQFEPTDQPGLDGLVCIMPANWAADEATLYSHQGLTYGGLILAPSTTQQQTLEAMQAILRYAMDMMQARRVVYKPIPYIYSVYPSQEDLYALFRCGGRLVGRGVSTTVALDEPLKMRTLRLRQAKKAVENGLYIERGTGPEDDNLAAFWGILEGVLREHHGVSPVHSLQEMRLLMSRFPGEIRLFTVQHPEAGAVAGCLLFVTRRVAHVQYIAANPQGRELGALDMLFRNLINDQLQGLSYLDFGISTEQGGTVLNEGLIFQKEGFGGRAVCYDQYEIPLDRDVVNTIVEAEEDPTERIKFFYLKAVNDSFEPELSNAIGQVMRSGWYLQGQENKLFASEFAAYCGVDHCLNVGNGLDALTLILRAYRTLHGWQEGDEVIVPANTFIASVLAVTQAGLKPILCEPDMADYNIHAAQVAPLITQRTRAIICVHLYGRVCDVEPLATLARNHGLRLIEDAAQAHGAIYRGRRTGALADAAAFSFYPAKNLGALGDAGAALTNDADLARMISMQQSYGYSQKYVCDVKGINSRMDEVQAAVLRVKLRRLDADNERRRQLAAVYAAEIDNPLVTLPPAPRREECVYYVYPIRTPHRDLLQQHLRRHGIDTQIYYPIPPHQQGAYAELAHLRLPITERIHRETLSLPISPMLSEAQVRRIAEVVNAFNVTD